MTLKSYVQTHYLIIIINTFCTCWAVSIFSGPDGPEKNLAYVSSSSGASSPDCCFLPTVKVTSSSGNYLIKFDLNYVYSYLFVAVIVTSSKLKSMSGSISKLSGICF